MSVYLELERLRFSLSNIGLPTTDIQNIYDAANGDINEVLLDIVSNAANQAIDYALEIGANEFMDDIQVLPDASGYYSISTHSGITDYSRSAQEMLPHLLKNAKTSNDGHRYKVIPIRKKDSQVQQSMFSALQARQDNIDEARMAIRAQSRKSGIADLLNTNLSKQASIAKAAKRVDSGRTGEVEFRTASDRQDPHNSWVIPGKKIDMTEYIQELNRRIADAANSAVNDIIDSYYVLYIGS